MTFLPSQGGQVARELSGCTESERLILLHAIADDEPQEHWLFLRGKRGGRKEARIMNVCTPTQAHKWALVLR